MDAMYKDTSIYSLFKPDSWKMHSCQIQQLELFYPVCLIHILGIQWHECLTKTDILFHCNLSHQGYGYPWETLVSPWLGTDSLKKPSYQKYLHVI